MKTKIIAAVGAIALAMTTAAAMARNGQDNCANLKASHPRDRVSPLALLDPGPADTSAGRERRLSGCKSQWGLADLNGDGVLDAREVAHYNSALRSAAQAPLSDDDRPTEMGFIAECAATTAHE